MHLQIRTFEELTTKELYEILKARAAIFMMEQNICYNDMDDVDYQSLHFFYWENDIVTAYMRAYYSEKDKNTVRIGRVLTLKHGAGIGRRLLEESIPEIRSRMHCTKIAMDAQQHAIGFYEKFGFRVISDAFLEEGILHVVMEREL